MRRKSTATIVPLVLASAVLTGCHRGSRVEPDSVYLEANRVPPQPAPVIREVEVPVAIPQLRPLPPSQRASEAAESKTSEEVIAQANAQATVRPDPAGFIQAVQVYDYLPGAVYEVFASPAHLTTIALEPGEELITKAAGDTVQWFVGDTYSGAGADARTLLLVKPLKPNVQTNLVVSTNRRIYQIDLRSLGMNTAGGHSEVNWNYPQDLARQLARRYRGEATENPHVIDQPVDLSRLDFNYRIKPHGKSPRWLPQRVFTDGRKTYIAFPADLDTTEAPPLFVLGPHGDAQLVNYRVKGGYYIVDQVFDRAQLRLGEAPQTIVTLERLGAADDRRTTSSARNRSLHRR